MDQKLVSPLLGPLWSPLAAVASRWRGKSNAQIAVAVGAASIVPERPRVIVQIYKRNYSHSLIHQGRAFALNFLGQEQLHLIRDLGLVSGRDRDKLAPIGHRPGFTGSPVLEECWGYLDCRVVNAMDGGDMTCFLAEVVDGAVLRDDGPLWWRDARRRIPQEWLEEWERKQAAEIEFSRQCMGDIDYTPWLPDEGEHSDG